MNKLQWNLNKKANIFFHENAFENDVCEMSCHFVKSSMLKWHWKLRLLENEEPPVANGSCENAFLADHDDVIKWKHFPRYWPFVRGIHRSAVNYPHKGQWRGALMFSLICTRINGWVNNREAGDSRRHRALYDVTVMNSVNCVDKIYMSAKLFFFKSWANSQLYNTSPHICLVSYKLSDGKLLIPCEPNRKNSCRDLII